MRSLRTNIVANYCGQAIGLLTAFLVVPFYIKYLGAEAYGLVGFFISLQAVLLILDLGLSVTANREISRVVGQKDGVQTSRRILRTLEVFYAIVGFLVFAGVGLASGWIARDLINARELSVHEISTALILAGATIGMRWPVSLYQGVLRGLERQVLLNGIASSIAIIRSAGSVLVLAYISQSVIAFYTWQWLIACLELVVMFIAAWSGLRSKSAPPAIFDFGIIRSLWRFSLTVAGASLFAVLLKQVDRLFVAKLLPIEQLGYYTTAVMAGMTVANVFTPIQTATFPRLSRLHAQNSYKELAETFHRSCLMVGFLVAPMAGTLMFFSHDILQFWTRSESFADNASAPLAWTAFAMLFNGMMSIPCSLAIASGMTWLPMTTNLIGVLILTPATYWFILRFGIVGAAWGWLLFNILYYLGFPNYLFRSEFRSEKLRWYLQDTLPFLILPIVIFGGCRMLAPIGPEWWVTLLILVAGGACYVLAALLFLPQLRGIILSQLQKTIQPLFRHS